MIKRIEEYTINAWPAISTLFYDGWVLRFADGFTKRANSVSPLYSSTINPLEKIRYCQGLYKAWKQETLFKMTKGVHPACLDRILEKEGYEYIAETSVQFLDLAAFRGNMDPEIKLIEQPDEKWFLEFSRRNKMSWEHHDIHIKVVNNIVLPKAAFSLYEDEDIIGFGLGVIENGYLGIYDILVAELRRGRGIGFRIMSSLLSWGKSMGARYSYLQVKEENRAGWVLYKKLGYKELYRYWYRRLEG